MIQIENLIKRYGERNVLNRLNLTINNGEILGFLGPNGAGKSTTMNIITGYISPTEGYVRVDGLDILKNPKAVKKKIGYLPEIPPLYVDMTVEEYLKFVGKIKDISSSELTDVVEKVCEVVNIAHIKPRLIKNLSKGYKQRVGLAQAIIGSPEILILDEPTVGLDPKEIIEIRNLIRELGKNHTVLLSSHILSEVSALCDRVIIINKGEIVASGTPNELSQRLNCSNKLLVRVRGKVKDILGLLNEVEGVSKVNYEGSQEENTEDILLESEPEKDIREVLFWTLAKAEIPVLMMRPVDLSLEEVFLQVTK